jgi:CheY-like chemotaxis protein
MRRLFQLWVLDDNAANLAMIERSLPDPVRSSINVRFFDDAKAFLSAFEQCCRSPQESPPDFVLLDFFLGYTYGSAVLDCMSRTAEEVGAVPPVIIAHSSMPEASSSLVERGADFALAKEKGQPTSPPITATFASVEAIEYIRRHRRPMTLDRPDTDSRLTT